MVVRSKPCYIFLYQTAWDAIHHLAVTICCHVGEIPEWITPGRSAKSQSYPVNLLQIYERLAVRY